MAEALVNDFETSLTSTLAAAAGAGSTFTVAPPLPAAAVGSRVRLRVGREIVLATVTDASTLTVVTRAAEDADRFPAATHGPGTAADVGVLTRDGFAALVGQSETLPAGGAVGEVLQKSSAADFDSVWFPIFGTANVWTQPQTVRGGMTVRNAADTRAVFATSEAAIATGYDAGHVALIPNGAREYRIGTYDAAGEWLFGRSDVTGMMAVYLSNTDVSFGARGTDTLSLKLGGGTIVLCPGAAGGDRKVQIGRRVTDDSAAVGASTELWTRTGQALPALAVKAPGGASDLMRIDANGAVTPASLADASAPNGSLYYSTTAGRLVYKDAAGVVNVLY